MEYITVFYFCLLECLSRLSHLSFLYHTGPPAQGWYHLQWTVPFNTKKCTTDWPVRRFCKGIFSIEIPVSHMTLACSKMK